MKSRVTSDGRGKQKSGMLQNKDHSWKNVRLFNKKRRNGTNDDTMYVIAMEGKLNLNRI